MKSVRDPQARTLTGARAHPGKESSCGSTALFQPRRVSCRPCSAASPQPHSSAGAAEEQSVTRGGFPQNEVFQPCATARGQASGMRRAEENQETLLVAAPGLRQLPCGLLSVNTCLGFPICDLSQEGEGGDHLPHRVCCGDDSAVAVTLSVGSAASWSAAGQGLNSATAFTLVSQ